MKLLWTYKTDNEPRQMHSLHAPLVIGSLPTTAGPKQVVVVGGVSDNVYAIDASSGALLWKEDFDSTYQPAPAAGGRGGGGGGSLICPGGRYSAARPLKYMAILVSIEGLWRF